MHVYVNKCRLTYIQLYTYTRMLIHMHTYTDIHHMCLMVKMNSRCLPLAVQLPSNRPPPVITPLAPGHHPTSSLDLRRKHGARLRRTTWPGTPTKLTQSRSTPQRRNRPRGTRMAAKRCEAELKSEAHGLRRARGARRALQHTPETFGIPLGEPNPSCGMKSVQ